MHHAGFEVVVFEKVREFLRLGDSLGLGENAFKLLDRWSPSLRDRLIEIGNKSPNMQIRRWHDGKILAQQPLMDMAGYIGHRGDYHKGFLDAVAEKGIPLHMGTEVSPKPEAYSHTYCYAPLYTRVHVYVPLQH